MNRAEDAVTVLHRVNDHPDGGKIVDLAEIFILLLHLVVDTVEMFRPTLDLGGHPDRFQPFLNDIDQPFDELLPLPPLFGQLIDEPVVGSGLHIAESVILELPFDLVDPQPVGQRRIDLHRLPGDLLLPARIQIAQGAQVVGAVGQLDQHHADIFSHGDEHFPQGFRLLLLPGSKIKAAQLGHPVDQGGGLLAEECPDLLQGDRGILDHIVEQPGNDGRQIEAQLGQDHRHPQGVGDK